MSKQTRNKTVSSDIVNGLCSGHGYPASDAQMPNLIHNRQAPAESVSIALPVVDATAVAAMRPVLQPISAISFALSNGLCASLRPPHK